MWERGGTGKRKKTAKVETELKELIGDESGDDDLSEDELDDEEKENVQAVHNSHIDDSTKCACRLSQMRLVLFLIKRHEEGGSRKHRSILEERVVQNKAN
jgi:hypothetical protein